MTYEEIKSLTFKLLDRKNLPWEIMEIRENDNSIMVYINYLNSDGSLGVELWFHPPLYEIDKKTKKVERIYMIEDIGERWEKSKVVYLKKMSLNEAKSIINREENYRLYTIDKIYENDNYFKIIIYNKIFNLRKIVVFDRNKNDYFDLDSSNDCLIKGFI